MSPKSRQKYVLYLNFAIKILQSFKMHTPKICRDRKASDAHVGTLRDPAANGGNLHGISSSDVGAPGGPFAGSGCGARKLRGARRSGSGGSAQDGRNSSDAAHACWG